MRCLVLPLILAVSANAGEEALLHVFKVAREDAYSPRGKARMDRAIEGLAKGGGVQSVIALGEFLRESQRLETKLRKERLIVQRRGRVAYTGIEQVKRELEHLRHRENAGATGLGPQITARIEKQRSMERALESAKTETVRSIRRQDEVVGKRNAGVEACSRILSRLSPDEVRTAIGSLRKSLDVDEDEPVLLLVRMLRRSKRKEAASALLEVLSHPKTGAAGRTSAACAVAYLVEPITTRQLVERMRQDKLLDQKLILHELGLAARQRFKNLDEAAKWAATLK